MTEAPDHVVAELIEPCPVPWCRGEADADWYDVGKQPCPYWVRCKRCGCKTPKQYATVREAIAAWNTRPEAADQLTVLSQRIGVLEAERDDLRVSVIAFAGPWATEWSRDRLPKGHLHPTHYDLLERCGARMDDFTRAALPPNGETK